LNREQHLSYRTAAWTTPEETQAFVSEVQAAVATEDVLAMLRLLTDKGLAADAAAHRRRCAVFAQLAAGIRDRALFAPYVSALKVQDRLLRAAIAPLIPQVIAVSDHPALCELLRSRDEELRVLAAKALKQVGGKTVLALISAMVGEQDFAGRREALDLIVPLAGHHAIPALAAAMVVGKPPEKRQALRYLCDRRYVGASVTAALEAITPAFSDTSEPVVLEGIAAFASLCDEDGYFATLAPFLQSTNPAVAAAAVAGLHRHDSPRAVEALERKLYEGPTTVRLAVLAAMEAMASDSVVPGLVEALSHRTLNVRTRAAEVLSGLSQAGRIDLSRTIVYLLRTGDVELRRTAADLARSVTEGRDEIWPKLVRFLRDEDWWVRERVIDALLELAGRALTPLLSEFLSDPSDVVRRFGVEVLARLHDPEAVALLARTALNDEDWWVRERAVEALAAFGDPAVVPHIQEVMDSVPGTEIACLQALLDLKAVKSTPSIAALLDSDDPDVRLKALECLDGLLATDHSAEVERLAGDPNPAVCKLAREVLGRWKLTGRPIEVTGSLSSLDTLLVACAENRADDLIIAPGQVPYLKKLGRMGRLGKTPLSAAAVEALLAPHLSSGQLAELRAAREVDFSYDVASHGLRFRANVFRQLGGTGAVFRIIAGHVPELERLALPAIVASFAGYRDGLVLVGGPTGSGKSTTMAALIDRINRDTTRHVISLEDPIEFVYPRRKALVNQREVGTHLRSTATALRSMLRQDPDVLVVGEMRDLATISFAVTAAETGHLVLGTLHTASADTTIDRIVNSFPPNSRDQVRSMLADSLRAVLCQHLIPKRDRTGRVLAAEILINNDAVANLIRKGKAFQIPSVVATSRELGMQSMDGELRRLVREGVISPEEAYMRAASKKEFEQSEVPAAPAAPAAPGAPPVTVPSRPAKVS
jgi:twitching motility protein PilT